MDDETLKTLLSCLNREAFKSFVVELFDSKARDRPLCFIDKYEKDVFYRGLLDSYGESIHSVFVLQHLPVDLVKNPQKYLLYDRNLSKTLKSLTADYKGKRGSYGFVSESLISDYKLNSLQLITNLHNVEHSTYFETFLPEFESMVRKIFRRKTLGVAIGSYDSFLDLSNENTKQVFEQFISQKRDGISISLSNENIEVAQFTSERTLSGGVLAGAHFPYEPVFKTDTAESHTLLKEFEFLLNKHTSESELENFLTRYYREIFGDKYDRVETQLWLRFPEIDVSNRQRRIDLFLRNSVINDWELFEIKQVTKLTATYRDVPVLSAEITGALSQIRNYQRILQSDKVKRHFEKDGIVYFEPTLNLIVGRQPQIPHSEWRWLVSNSKDIKVITYDDLIKELTLRLQTRYKLDPKK